MRHKLTAMLGTVMLAFGLVTLSASAANAANSRVTNSVYSHSSLLIIKDGVASRLLIGATDYKVDSYYVGSGTHAHDAYTDKCYPQGTRVYVSSGTLVRHVVLHTSTGSCGQG